MTNIKVLSIHWQIIEIDMRHWKDVGKYKKTCLLYKPIKMRFKENRKLMQEMYIVLANWNDLLRKRRLMQTSILLHVKMEILTNKGLLSIK